MSSLLVPAPSQRVAHPSYLVALEHEITPVRVLSGQDPKGECVGLDGLRKELLLPPRSFCDCEGLDAADLAGARAVFCPYCADHFRETKADSSNQVAFVRVAELGFRSQPCGKGRANWTTVASSYRCSHGHLLRFVRQKEGMRVLAFHSCAEAAIVFAKLRQKAVKA